MKHFQWRIALLSALSEFQVTRAGEIAKALGPVITTLEEIAPLLADEEGRALEVIRELGTAFRCLCDWAAARRSAEANAVRYLDAAKEHASAAAKQLAQVAFPALRDAVGPVTEAIAATTETSSLPDIARLLSCVPVPPFLILCENPFGKPTEAKEATPSSPVIELPFVVRVMLTLDGRPWANPQMLRAGTVYDLKAKITAPAWPSGSDRLVLDFISTLPPEHRRVSLIEVFRSHADSEAEIAWSGHIEFPVGQSVLAEPALLQMRANFLSAADATFAKTATIIGYHKLRVRVSDPKATPLLSKFRMLDQRLVAIVDEVRDLPGLGQEHLGDFIELLSAILNYMGICAQQALYRAGSKILEKDFQRDLLVHLRGQLGEDVQEAPKLGGGITDIRYRSVIAELKVEKDIADREEMLQAYQNQPTQYSGATGAQLGILCVLDLTEKTLPPAPPQNNVQLLTPTLHGFGGTQPPFPVRIAAVVIDGNIRKPSDYSR